MRMRNLLLMTTALVPFAITSAMAGPEGATVVGGSVTVQNPGTANVTVNQFSDKAIVNWHTFNIGVNERTQFNQPNSNSVILNRVTGGLGPFEGARGGGDVTVTIAADGSATLSATGSVRLPG